MNDSLKPQTGTIFRRVVSRMEDYVCEEAAAGSYIGNQAGSPAIAAEIFSMIIGHEAQEVVAVLLLDMKHNLIAYDEISRGSLGSSIVHPREIFSSAVRLGAGAIIVGHNHPSGDPEPSGEDVAVSRRLVDAGALMGIPVLDHIVVGSEGRFVGIRGRTLSIDWSGCYAEIQ